MADVHRVKSWSYLFQAAKNGLKTHDVRDMRDRDYKVGDTLVLCEFDQATGKYTGEELAREITYITDRQVLCTFSSAVLDRDFGILSIKPLN